MRFFVFFAFFSSFGELFFFKSQFWSKIDKKLLKMEPSLGPKDDPQSNFGSILKKQNFHFLKSFSDQNANSRQDMVGVKSDPFFFTVYISIATN